MKQAVLPKGVTQTARPAPGSPAELYQRALTMAAMSFHEAATEALQAVTAAAPGQPEPWRKLAELLRLKGEDAKANVALGAANFGESRTRPWPLPLDPRPAEALEEADRQWRDILAATPAGARMDLLRQQLMENHRAVVAMYLLASLEWRDGDEVTAFALLERALELAPAYARARYDLARLLLARRNFVRAAAEAARLVQDYPARPVYRALLGEARRHLGDFAGALAQFEIALEQDRTVPAVWLGYGHTLLTFGRADDAAAAFRNCLAVAPSSGEAYFGLATMKGGHLTGQDMAAMRALLAADGLELESRASMQYALAHALERAGDYAASFAAYESGARDFRQSIAHSPSVYDEQTMMGRMWAVKSVFSAELFAARPASVARAGAVTPIFIVGMPRAGSTLVEQILASHSQVEGTSELPVMTAITRELTLSRRMLTPLAYPECALDLSPAQLAALGARYITDAGAFRHTSLPYFVDKRPWNWFDAGLIRLILPHAKIIDIRRAPMAACFAMFKQKLPVDAAFSYDQTELGHYYREYAGVMDHWSTVMPGHIHFLRYETLVDDTEAEIRRLLAFCGLPFEENCLRFWETSRAVSTPSAEQVRRPIFREALEQWRHFEPWLGELKSALGEKEGLLF